VDYRAAVAVILAAGVAVAVVLLSIGAENATKAISAEDANLLSTVLGAAVGAVATYLGTLSRPGPGPGPDPDR
jgi:hypothetical protein